MHKFLLVLLVSAAITTSCSNDEEPLDAYQFSLAEITANANGRAASMELDNGKELLLRSPINGLKADSIYRIQALYVVGTDGKTSIKDVASVLTPKVMKFSEEKHIYDALDVTTCWKGKHYINLRLAVKGSATGVHYFGFNQTDFVANANGSKTMKVHLVHNQNKDPLYYTRDTYLSLPLRPLANLLQNGRDSISLSVSTFEGEKYYIFAL